jgi:imidazolonepropionase-like amidohydrolase
MKSSGPPLSCPPSFWAKARNLGQSRRGQRADLLLVNGNPLENLTALEHPNGVMVRGKWLPRQNLAERLKQLAHGE